MGKKIDTLPFPPPFKEVSLVYWKDAYVTTDDDPNLNHVNSLTISIGVIVKKDDKEIILSTFYDGIGQKMDSPFHVIPTAMVKHIKVIKTK